MARAFQFEDFSTPEQGKAPATGASSSLSDQELEERRLVAYEEGYSAGWNDAIASDTDNQTRISESFAGNLSDLSFTFQEARSNILGATEPIFREMVQKLFPELTEAALCDNVISRLKHYADAAASQPVELVVSPENRSALENLVTRHSGLDLVVTEEPTLGEGQVFLRFGKREEKIDLAEIKQGFEEAIAAFFSSNSNIEDVKYG